MMCDSARSFDTYSDDVLLTDAMLIKANHSG